MHLLLSTDCFKCHCQVSQSIKTDNKHNAIKTAIHHISTAASHCRLSEPSPMIASRMHIQSWPMVFRRKLIETRTCFGSWQCLTGPADLGTETGKKHSRAISDWEVAHSSW